MIKYDLCGKWLLNGMDEYKNISAKVPGSVIADLLDNGIIADPYYKENEYAVRDLFYKDFSYKRTFSVSKEILEQDVIELVCYGLDTLADIYVNGNLIAKVENMHVEWRFDLRMYICQGENEIEILFHSPLNYMKKAWDEDGEVSYVATGNIPGTSFLRKAHCMCGWDWGPQLPDAGIWRDIAIEAFSGARLKDLNIVQHHQENSVTLKLDAEITRLSVGQIELEVEITTPQGEKISKTVSFENETSTSFEVVIENPQLWWPNNLGEQHLYNVQSLLKCNGKTVDERNMRIGLRTIVLSRENDQWGQEFCFKVNGIKIFGMGADYIPEDNIFRNITPDKTRKLLKDCVDANFNSIRVWGGGYYPDSFFFDICDELGLLVWLDLMYACNVYRLTDSFEKNVVLETEQNIQRVRHHASLALICGNNEMEWAWCDWETVKNHNAVLKADYLKLFEVILTRTVKRIAPEVEFWAASPSSGGSFDKPNDPNRGDVHYWDVWHGNKPFTDYRNFYFRFCSEFGFESFPSVKTIKSFAEPQDMNIFSRVMESHQKNGVANGKILWYIAQNYKYPKSFDSLVYTSQILQADATKYGVEHWRRNRGRCMGSIYWQINDCWPVASWSSIDYYGRWKALHYYAKKFYSPVLISALDNGPLVDLYVTNDSLEKIKGEIIWYLRDNSGKVIKADKVNIEVGALTVDKACALDFIDYFYQGELHPEDKLVLDYRLISDSKCISENSLLFTQAKHFEFLDPEISYTVSENELEFILDLSTVNFAKGVCLELSEDDCRFSDNWFDLYSNEIRRITVKKDSLSDQIDIKSFKRQLTIVSVYDI